MLNVIDIGLENLFIVFTTDSEQYAIKKLACCLIGKLH